MTALSIAVMLGKIASVRWLLKNKAELHINDKKGMDACDHAQRHEELKTWPEF